MPDPRVITDSLTFCNASFDIDMVALVDVWMCLFCLSKSAVEDKSCDYVEG